MYPHNRGGPPPQQNPPPPNWDPQQPSGSAAPPGQPQHPDAYPRPPSQHLPPPSQIPSPHHPQDGRPDMTAVHGQSPYRLPAPHEMYRPPPPNPYGSQPPQVQYAQPQPAPRQRTAIACRYCRRRKIRCSGFDASEDGRCTNCVRFSQECIFMPVASQTQAFVPAHTVWRGNGQPPQLYGAYGQPLQGPQPQTPPHHPSQDPYAPGPSTSAYPPPPQHQQHPQAQSPYYTAPHQPPVGGPPPPRHASPQQHYGYDNRTSTSPLANPPSTPYQYPPPGPAADPHRQSVGPPRQDGSTPPPRDSSSSSRPGMSIRDIVSDPSGGRSSADSQMLNALNRRPM